MSDSYAWRVEPALVIALLIENWNYRAGCVTALASKVTAVCANSGKQCGGYRLLPRIMLRFMRATRLIPILFWNNNNPPQTRFFILKVRRRRVRSTHHHRRCVERTLHDYCCFILSRYCIFYGAGFVTALVSRVTAVCANSLLFADAPVRNVIDVCDSTTPSMCAVVPTSTAPKDCQKIFLGSAPPVKITRAPDAWVIPWATWNIQTSLGPPLSVTSVGIKSPVPHL